MTDDKKAFDIKLGRRSQNSTMYLYPEKLDVKMRPSWYRCVSPMCVRCGLLVETTFRISDVPECTCRLVRRLPAFSWLVV